MTVLPAGGADFASSVPVLVVGAGAAGLVAALRAAGHAVREPPTA